MMPSGRGKAPRQRWIKPLLQGGTSQPSLTPLGVGFPRAALIGVVVALVVVLSLAACGNDTETQEAAQPTQYLRPMPTATAYPTATPYPTSTPYPTPTRLPADKKPSENTMPASAGTATSEDELPGSELFALISPSATPLPAYTPEPTTAPRYGPVPIPAPTAIPDQQGSAWNYSRIEWIRDRGYLVCASRNDVPGWGHVEGNGNNAGFDIDLCRAVAAAVLGDPSAIEIRLISAAERGPTIQSGEVDMMVRTVTWTSSRDVAWGSFAQIMFYDGQGFTVRKELGIDTALDLDGASVCVTQGTTTELNLLDFSDQHNLGITALTFEDTGSAFGAYEDGQCDAYTNDHSQLGALRVFLGNPSDHATLPETISEEPLAPLVPHGDEQWADIVRTVMAILIWSEAYAITSDSVPTSQTGNYNVDRLFGLSGSWGQQELGLSGTTAQDVIAAVGNYGEIYDRNLGAQGLGLLRENTRNALWEAAPCSECPKGGQIYAPPLR